MDKTLFNELIESLEQAGEIMRGERPPSRTFELAGPEVKRIRQSVGLSQDRFAALIHVKASTLRNWEQGRRSPSGAAAALLTAIQNDPVNVIAALNSARQPEPLRR